LFGGRAAKSKRKPAFNPKPGTSAAEQRKPPSNPRQAGRLFSSRIMPALAAALEHSLLPIPLLPEPFHRARAWVWMCAAPGAHTP